MFSCDVGDIPFIKVVFTDANGTVIDPTTITLYVQQPDRSVGTYDYASGSVQRLAAGTYTFNGTATMPGYWNVRWVGDGAAIAAEQSQYFVRNINT